MLFIFNHDRYRDRDHDQFKSMFIDTLLTTLENFGIGLSIGDMYTGTPTCADVVIFLSDNPADLQAMLDFQLFFAIQNRCQVSDKKNKSYGFQFSATKGLPGRIKSLLLLDRRNLRLSENPHI